jgi:hypothetical protein
MTEAICATSFAGADKRSSLPISEPCKLSGISMSSSASVPLSRIERVSSSTNRGHAVRPFGDAVDEPIRNRAQ